MSTFFRQWARVFSRLRKVSLVMLRFRGRRPWAQPNRIYSPSLPKPPPPPDPWGRRILLGCAHGRRPRKRSPTRDTLRSLENTRVHCLKNVDTLDREEIEASEKSSEGVKVQNQFHVQKLRFRISSTCTKTMSVVPKMSLTEKILPTNRGKHTPVFRIDSRWPKSLSEAQK